MAADDLATLLAEHRLELNDFVTVIGTCTAEGCTFRSKAFNSSTVEEAHRAHVAEVIEAAGWRQVPEVMQDVRVEVEHRLNEPTACKVWRSGALVFDGVDKSAGADR